MIRAWVVVIVSLIATLNREPESRLKVAEKGGGKAAVRERRLEGAEEVVED